jgi:hypothetical protein
MKSYVAIMFAFLAVAFYQLSGGADYAPQAGSLQVEMTKARAERAVQFAETTRIQLPKLTAPTTRTATPTVVMPAVVTRTTTAVDLTARPVPPQAPKASAVPDVPGPTIIDAQQRLESYSLARLSPAQVTRAVNADPSQAQTKTLTAAVNAALNATDDIRSVQKSRVNMRMGPGTEYEYDVLTKLDAGMRVNVLETTGTGWVRLRVIDTGRIGWMAETLISAAN